VIRGRRSQWSDDRHAQIVQLFRARSPLLGSEADRNVIRTASSRITGRTKTETALIRWKALLPRPPFKVAQNPFHRRRLQVPQSMRSQGARLCCPQTGVFAPSCSRCIGHQSSLRIRSAVSCMGRESRPPLSSSWVVNRFSPILKPLFSYHARFHSQPRR